MTFSPSSGSRPNGDRASVRTDYRCTSLQGVRLLSRPASLITYPGQHFGFSPVLRFKPFAPSVRGIARIAAELCEVTIQDMAGPSRMGYLVRARALTVWTAKYFRGEMSWAQIGLVVGRRDHSTLINLFDHAQRWRLEDPDFRELSDALVARASAEL